MGEAVGRALLPSRRFEAPAGGVVNHPRVVGKLLFLGHVPTGRVELGLGRPRDDPLGNKRRAFFGSVCLFALGVGPHRKRRDEDQKHGQSGRRKDDLALTHRAPLKSVRSLAGKYI